MLQPRGSSSTRTEDASDEEVQRFIIDDDVTKKQQGSGLTSAHLAIIAALILALTAVLCLAKSSSPASSKTLKVAAAIPECIASPWKTGEDLVGPCPGELKPYEAATDLVTCAEHCCASAECISWQFRKDVGCLHGPDVRLGLETDEPEGWCHDAPPARWQGQFLEVKDEDDNSKILKDQRVEACDVKMWKPHEKEGQCFGLGDVRSKEASASAEACMAACCNDKEEPICGAWQWDKHLGCFYGNNMYGCTKTEDPTVFEPFTGRRKNQLSRSYLGPDGQPFKQRSPGRF
jgi:hypothetical protein